MNYEVLSFANRQLAEMLRHGMPLEGALRQLSAGMAEGALKLELQALEADLAKGMPLTDALNRRELPEFYRQMWQMGARGQDLPGLLNLLADYYHALHGITLRLKGIMVYPVIVLGAALGISILIAWLMRQLVASIGDFSHEYAGLMSRSPVCELLMWLPAALVAVAALAVLVVLAAPSCRRAFRWRLPGFRESALSQFGSAMSLLLRSGNTLDEALRFMARMEGASPLGRDLAEWRERLAAGKKRFTEFTAGGRVCPPLFLWLVDQAGEDLAGGFERAAALYRSRAQYRIEMMLYAALPVSVLGLGVLVVIQVMPALRSIIQFTQMLGDVGG
ncbi:MAG TPA: type II secretion system F family protein [Candidatus Paceibacterota bacterium]|nr:type II secretion system F family protein [Verrucomicrobiota bacterium]HRZ44694.1 type II secretion system F family protein [Candidatus Paceibacterota bacterium]HRZ91680.1 type II secretion system F family protein [Candidatus Paceibacterota bacterium]